jgi:hypothetical protein
MIFCGASQADSQVKLQDRSFITGHHVTMLAQNHKLQTCSLQPRKEPSRDQSLPIIQTCNPQPKGKSMKNQEMPRTPNSLSTAQIRRNIKSEPSKDLRNAEERRTFGVLLKRRRWRTRQTKRKKKEEE